MILLICFGLEDEEIPPTARRLKSGAKQKQSENMMISLKKPKMPSQRKKKLGAFFQQEDSNSTSSEETVNPKQRELIDSLLPSIVSKCSYETELKDTYIWSGASLENKIKNHILILGYVDGLDYYLESIRWESGIPIIICAEERYAKSISKLLNKYDYLYYYVDNPKVADVLK